MINSSVGPWKQGSFGVENKGGSMNYQIAVRDGFRTVTGWPVKIDGFKNYSFFYRKDDDYEYIISEVSTGKIIGRGYTLLCAREHAHIRLTDNKVAFIKYVREAA